MTKEAKLYFLLEQTSINDKNLRNSSKEKHKQNKDCIFTSSISISVNSLTGVNEPWFSIRSIKRAVIMEVSIESNKDNTQHIRSQLVRD